MNLIKFGELKSYSKGLIQFKPLLTKRFYKNIKFFLNLISLRSFTICSSINFLI